jgi:hypothetical protein
MEFMRTPVALAIATVFTLAAVASGAEARGRGIGFGLFGAGVVAGIQAHSLAPRKEAEGGAAKGGRRPGEKSGEGSQPSRAGLSGRVAPCQQAPGGC